MPNPTNYHFNKKMSLYYESDESDGETMELVKKCYPPAQEPEEPISPFYCAFCQKDVCLWYQLQDVVESTIEWNEIAFQDIVDEAETEKEYKNLAASARKLLYAAITRELYGILGRGNRIRLPECILQNVRGMYPSPDNKYMGHKDE